MKKKIGLQGANGKMGIALQKELLDHEKFEWHAEWFAKSPEQTVDVVVDFSTPEGFLAGLNWCAQFGVPFVTGTTGLGQSETEALKKAAQKIAVLHSANFSMGIFWLRKMLAGAQGIKGFDIVIEEVHHTQKRDRPSGTALAIKDTIVSSKISDSPEMISIRAGTVFGQHRISLFGKDESIVLEHQAQSRSVFAIGALEMAAKIINKKPGLYRVEDLA